MCVLFWVVQLHPLCCISHIAVLHSNKIQIQIQTSVEEMFNRVAMTANPNHRHSYKVM